MKKSTIIIIIVVLLGLVFMFSRSIDKKDDQPDQPTLPHLMKLTSSAFSNNSSIPIKYTCDGDDINPPLSISEMPENTQSLVLVLDDPDAPMGSWTHWLVFNISPFNSGISENGVPAGSIEGENSFGTNAYGGPCPPSGSHKYVFKLYALDIVLDLSPAAAIKDVGQAMQEHILDEAELIGNYQKK